MNESRRIYFSFNTNSDDVDDPISYINMVVVTQTENDATKLAIDFQKRLLLPDERGLENSPGHGWLVPTTVKASSMEGAGNGRCVSVAHGCCLPLYSSHLTVIIYQYLKTGS